MTWCEYNGYYTIIFSLPPKILLQLLLKFRLQPYIKVFFIINIRYFFAKRHNMFFTFKTYEKPFWNTTVISQKYGCSVLRISLNCSVQQSVKIHKEWNVIWYRLKKRQFYFCLMRSFRAARLFFSNMFRFWRNQIDTLHYDAIASFVISNPTIFTLLVINHPCFN